MFQQFIKTIDVLGKVDDTKKLHNINVLIILEKI